MRQIRHLETLEPGQRVEIPRHCGAAEVQELELQIRQGAEVPMDPGAVERQKSEMWRLLESLDVPRQVRRGQLYLSASQRQFLVDVDKYV